MSFSIFLEREQLEEVRKRAERMMVLILERIADAMIDEQGLVYGQFALDRPERILKVIDMAQTGVLDELGIIAPKHQLPILREFRRDIRAVGISEAEAAAIVPQLGLLGQERVAV